MLHNRTILVIICGGIAAYKSCELIRLLKNDGARVVVVMTAGAGEFITPLLASALSGEKTYSELFDLTDEQEMGHIQLAKMPDAIIIAPATADFLAKMAIGRADDLASTIICATRAPIFCAPAMNPAMFDNPANHHNLEILSQRGVHILQPDSGAMACGDIGVGRMQEPASIRQELWGFLHESAKLMGKKFIVSAGPTREKLDQVRYISNFSSGKQGFAIADALAKQGAEVILVAGPCQCPTPKGVKRINVETALQMLETIEGQLPADGFIGVAAVADWRARHIASEKIKKANGAIPALDLVENPDIIKTISNHSNRPKLVVGFAAETFDAVTKALPKYRAKNLDWILVNDIGLDNTILGGDNNHIIFINQTSQTDWGIARKTDHADHLTQEIIAFFS